MSAGAERTQGPTKPQSTPCRRAAQAPTRVLRPDWRKARKILDSAATKCGTKHVPTLQPVLRTHRSGALLRSLHDDAPGHGMDSAEPKVLAVARGPELDAAGCARAGFGPGRCAAGVADAEEVCDAGAALGEGPELAGAGPADDGSWPDLAALDHGDDDFIGAPWVEGLTLVADVPGAHAVLRGLAGEGLEQPPAVAAAGEVGRGGAAVWAQQAGLWAGLGRGTCRRPGGRWRRGRWAGRLGHLGHDTARAG